MESQEIHSGAFDFGDKFLRVKISAHIRTGLHRVIVEK
jgi:hypothetical protein